MVQHHLQTQFRAMPSLHSLIVYYIVAKNRKCFINKVFILYLYQNFKKTCVKKIERSVPKFVTELFFGTNNNHLV